MPLCAEGCSTPDVTLVYPQLANMTNMWGDVLIHLQIGADGRPAIISIQWKSNQKFDPPPMLGTAAKDTALSIRYPLDCASEIVDLELSYRKKDPIGPLNLGTSERIGPNHFQVTTNEYATDQQAVTVKVGKQSFWGWLFHR
jgi:hypothetical protein